MIGFHLGTHEAHRLADAGPAGRTQVGTHQAALAGQKTMQEALDTAVERSNAMLAKFAKTYAGKTLP